MPHELIFGYGSLVNTATHDYPTLKTATLTGWRRTWHFTHHRDIGFLSIAADPAASILGAILKAPAHDRALKNRERVYMRHTVTRQTTHNPTPGHDIYAFAVPPTTLKKPDQNSTLLLSYIDVVVQGYFNMSGAPGVRDFFATTHGWGAKIINDRAAPLYPRHQTLSPQQTTLVDEGLAAISAKTTRH